MRWTWQRGGLKAISYAWQSELRRHCALRLIHAERCEKFAAGSLRSERRNSAVSRRFHNENVRKSVEIGILFVLFRPRNSLCTLPPKETCTMPLKARLCRQWRSHIENDDAAAKRAVGHEARQQLFLRPPRSSIMRRSNQAEVRWG